MTQTTTNDRSSAPIIPPDLAIRAMRDSGYKNTAYALAELIDNSVQADADAVEVLCLEETKLVNSRSRRRLSEIGVLDNGKGMEPLILQLALQFGNGTHLDDRVGIGRFGMGLPNSSISQCRRVDVWTWQSGPGNAIHTYLDVDEVEQGTLTSIKPPSPEPLPRDWCRRSRIVSTSGTLVVWSKLEDHRITWRGARATLTHTENIVGRMYRHFINKGQLRIDLRYWRDGESFEDREVKVNDPLYLMSNSSTPAPFDVEPMFQKWGDENEVFTVDYSGQKHDVVVRMSWALPKTNPTDGGNRGDEPYGKHAAKNLGISIVRAGRELDLDSSWTNSYDPVERWWGVEVEFPPALDEIFGVTNSKQHAVVFAGMSQFDWKSEADEGESLPEFRDRIRQEGDPRSYLIDISIHIREQIAAMRNRLGDQNKGRRGTRRSRHDTATPADIATKKYRERAKGGYQVEEDTEEFTETDRDALEEDLKTDKQYSEDIAAEIANGVLLRNRKVEFVTKRMDDTFAFFNQEHHHGGLTTVVFNTDHPIYERLIETLEPDIGEESDSQLIDRINGASDTLKLLFAAWARYHMEDAPARRNLREVRQNWGRMAEFMLSESEQNG